MKVYFPSITNMTDSFPINFDIVAKITSNMKLNPIGPNGESNLSDLTSNEVHYMKLETNYKMADIKFS